MDWLAKLVALSYLLSRYLSLTTLRLPQNYYWYNSKFIKKIKKKLSTVNISLTQHPSAINTSKVFTVNISVLLETGTTGGPMTEFLGQVSHLRKICD